MSETKRDSAQVLQPKIDTAIRLDKRELDKAGLTLSGQEGSNAPVTPMAGKFLASQAPSSSSASFPDI